MVAVATGVVATSPLVLVRSAPSGCSAVDAEGGLGLQVEGLGLGAPFVVPLATVVGLTFRWLAVPVLSSRLIATGIGTPPDEPALQVYFLAGALPGLDVENPRQVSAWRYPRQYGPRSPLFSRGTILTLNGARQFLISGTASVIGHQTHHENQVADQLRESLRNVRSLLDEGHRLMGDARAQLDGDGILKVYIRDPADYERIRATLQAEAPADIPRIYLQGDICRENLLTEIDGIVGCAPVADST
mgnify:CR=1 FL=1